MQSNNSPLESIGVIKEMSKYYVEKRFDAVKLQLAKQSTQISSTLVTTLILMSLGLVLYVFVMLTIGLFLGSYLGSYTLGFGIVAIIIALTIAAIYTFKDKLITAPIIDQVLSQADFEHVNNMQDLAVEQRKLELMQDVAENAIIKEVSGIPNKLVDQFLDRHFITSKVAKLASYGIQTASNHFVKEQSAHPFYKEQDWWRPIMPVVVEFTRNYLSEYLRGLQLDANTLKQSNPMVTPSPTADSQAVVRETYTPRSKVRPQVEKI